jgi:hypothetical protein
VDRRARGLPALNRGKLRSIDRQYYNTEEGEVGPCQAWLESLGELLQIVVGAFGEASTDLDRLIRGIAESQVLYLYQQEGQPVTDAWTGQVHLEALTAIRTTPLLSTPLSPTRGRSRMSSTRWSWWGTTTSLW